MRSISDAFPNEMPSQPGADHRVTLESAIDTTVWNADLLKADIIAIETP